MNKIKVNLICLFLFLGLISCKADKDAGIGVPKITAGKAKITGKITSPNDRHKNNASVVIFVPHAVSGENTKYETVIDESGKFSIDVDLETDVSLIGLYTSLKPYNSLLFKVRSGSTTSLDMTYNLNLDISDVQTQPEMNKYEMIRSLPIINQMLGVYDAKPNPQISLDDTSPKAFIKHINSTISDKLMLLDKDSLFSKEWKAILARDFTIFYFRAGAFHYEKSIELAYKNTLRDSTIVPKIQKIDKSYFTFLKDMDLNNPEYLICSSFMDFQKEILTNDILSLPEIAEQDIPSWLTSVKASLADLIGFKDGQYYEILAANAYGKQLIQEKRPLTEKQVENIKDYWKEGEIAKILLRKNEKVTK